jgi:hypothetical protein
MKIKRVGLQPSGKGPSECFSVTVRIVPLILAPIRRSFRPPAPLSSPARAPHGITVRSVKPSSSPPVADGRDARRTHGGDPAR